MRDANFNKVAVGELSIDLMSTPAKITAKAAFINTLSGQTHGWTTCSQWSAATVEKLKELRALMEQDLAALHFADAVEGGANTGTTTAGSIKDNVKGLGEMLGSVAEEVPQG